MDGEQPCVTCLQLYSQKSHMSLTAGAIIFYSIHLTCLSITKENRRQHISSGRTIVEYLPVRFDYVENCNSVFCRDLRGKRQRVKIINLIESVNDGINYVLDPFRKLAYPGMLCVTNTRPPTDASLCLGILNSRHTRGRRHVGCKN